MSEMKLCKKCNRELPATLGYFFADESKKDGLKTECKDCNKSLKRVYRKNNDQKIKSWRKGYYKTNIENEVARRKKHNPKKRFYNHKRDASKAGLVGTLTKEQWEQCVKVFNHHCCYCGEKVILQQDHFIPLTKSGEYTINNIVPACPSCNINKYNNDFFEWYPRQPFYSKFREKTILNYLHYQGQQQQLVLFV